MELNRKAIEAGVTMTPAHYFLALAYLDLKQEQAAMVEFEKAIQSPLVTPETYNALASLYIKKQQFAAAEDLCRKAIALDRSRPDAYLNLARIYNAQNASHKALEMLRAALPEGKEFPATEYYQGCRRISRWNAASRTRPRNCTLKRSTSMVARSISIRAAPSSTGAWRNSIDKRETRPAPHCIRKKRTRSRKAKGRTVQL